MLNLANYFNGCVTMTPTHAVLNAQVIIVRHTRCFISCFHYRLRVCVVIDIVRIALTHVRGYSHSCVTLSPVHSRNTLIDKKKRTFIAFK